MAGRPADAGAAVSGQQGREVDPWLRVILGQMESKPTPCRLCSELELHIVAAQRPEFPAPGLTEAGKRNRAQQRQEQIQRAEIDLEKHRKSSFCERNQAGE